MLKKNTKAPIFNLNSTAGKIYSLKDSISKYVVLYFYPKDDTPGCTIETNDFNKLLPKFKVGALVFVLSTIILIFFP